MCSTCCPRSILVADASLSSTGSSRASSPASTVLSKRYDILPPSRRTSFPSLGDTSVALVDFVLCQTSALSEPGVDNPVSPAGNCRGAKSRTLPSSWGTSMSVCTCSNPTPAGLLAPDHCGATAWPLVIERQRLPRLGLSTLNSIAFRLAVYASQCGLLQHHARLASSCWSGSTGRAFHPHGSAERFQSRQLHLILLSQACLAQWAQPASFLEIPCALRCRH